MAQTNLPVFSLPGFPRVLDSILDREIAHVDEILLRDELGSCCYSNRYASCHQRATICDLETGCGYCARHFGEVDCD